ncbi:hypothetical protein OG292_06210 [Streptomyces sp. NBC_01511]
MHGIAGFLPELAREAGEAAYAGGVSTVDLNRTGVDSLIGLSRASGIATDVHEPLKALLDRRSADGHGQDSISSVFELLRARGTAAPQHRSAAAPEGCPQRCLQPRLHIGSLPPY